MFHWFARHFSLTVVILVGVVVIVLVALLTIDRDTMPAPVVRVIEEMQGGPDIYPEVWSQHSPQGESWEYKVNCGSNYSTLEACFLWDMDGVRVTTPSGDQHELGKDFNINDYSGEVTRRWVLYGPERDHLPESGEYLFEYMRDDTLVYSQTVQYEQQNIAYPVDVRWERRDAEAGSDLYVEWTPPAGVTNDMWYKVIVWNDAGTPDLFLSDKFSWDATEALLQNVPLLDGGLYSMNVAVYYKQGYAYSAYQYFRW